MTKPLQRFAKVMSPNAIQFANVTKTAYVAAALTLLSALPAQAQSQHFTDTETQVNNHESFEVISFKFDAKGIDEKSVILLKTQTEIQRLNEYVKYENQRHSKDKGFLRSIQKKTSPSSASTVENSYKSDDTTKTNHKYANYSNTNAVENILSKKLEAGLDTTQKFQSASYENWLLKPGSSNHVSAQKFAKLVSAERINSAQHLTYLP